MTDPVIARLHSQAGAAVAGDLAAAGAAAAGLTVRLGEARAGWQRLAGVVGKPMFLGLSTALPVVGRMLRDTAGRAGGEWARQTDAIGRSWRRLQDVLGAPVFERLATTVLPRLGRALRMAVAGGERGGFEGALRAFDAGLGAGGRIAGALNAIAAVVRDTASTVRDWFIPAIVAAIDIFRALPGEVKTAGIALAAVAAVVLGGPVAIAAGLVAAAVLVHKHWHAIAGFFSGLWRTIRSGLGLTDKDFRRVFQAVRNVGVAAFAVLKVAVRALLPVFRAAIGGILRSLRGMARVIGGVVKVVSGLLTGDFRAAWEGMKQIASGAVEAVLGRIQSITAPARAALEGIWKGLGKAASVAFGAVKTVVVGVLNWVIDQVNKVIRGINSMAVDTPFGRVGVHIGEIGSIDAGGGGSRGGARARTRALTPSERRFAQKLNRPSLPLAAASGVKVPPVEVRVPVNLDGRTIARVHARVREDEAQWGRG